jgi:hypothetical protein
VITRGGRPALAPPRARVDSALVKALGRAFRWRRLRDTGSYATKEEIAAAGRQPDGMMLAWAIEEWEGQRAECGRRPGEASVTAPKPTLT